MRGGVDSGGNSVGDVYTSSPTGRFLRQITFSSRTDDENLAFSPDGRYIVFRRSSPDGNTNLATVDLRTDRVHALTANSARHLKADWQKIS